MLGKKSWGFSFTEPPPTLQVLFSGMQVAELKHQGQRYTFTYLPAFSELKLAPLPGLPLEKATHESRELFAFFAERIPDMRRPEIKQAMEAKHLRPEDDLRLLATFGAQSATDPFVLQLKKKTA